MLKYINTVKQLLIEKGYHINDNSNSFSFIEQDDIINIPKFNINKTKKYQIKYLCGLLHEAGHTLAGTTFQNISNRNKYKNNILIIESEYLAWKNGYDILVNNIIDTIDFNNIRSVYISEWYKYWSTYILNVKQLYKI